MWIKATLSYCLAPTRITSQREGQLHCGWARGGLQSSHAAYWTVKRGGPLENSLAGPQGVKHTITTWPRDSIPAGIAPRTLKTSTNKILYTRVHSSIIKRAPNGNQHKCSTSWWMAGKMWFCPHNGIVFRHKKAGRDLPGGPVAKTLCAQWRKPGFGPRLGN